MSVFYRACRGSARMQVVKSSPGWKPIRWLPTFGNLVVRAAISTRQVSISATTTPIKAVPNRDLLLPYFAPYAAYVAIASFAGGLGHEIDYLLRIVVTGALLLYFRKFYRIRGPGSPVTSVLIGAAAGVFGVLVWVGLLLPFHDASVGDAYDVEAFALRLAAATLIVPFAEELLCRGYILGLVTQWQQERRAGRGSFGDVIDLRSIHELAPGAWTPLALFVSSAAFALGHSMTQWPAAIAYGLLMASLWIARRDLIAPIVAHAFTNLVLYIYVYKTESWGLW